MLHRGASLSPSSTITLHIFNRLQNIPKIAIRKSLQRRAKVDNYFHPVEL